MEKISAYLDGQCGEFEAAQTLRQLRDDDAAREAWALFHRAGDALRGDPLVSGDFTARVMARLEGEAVVLAPRRHNAMTRYALSAAASLAGVAVVLGMVFQGSVDSGPGVAQQPAPAVVAQSAPSAREVSTLLAAHQDYASGSTIHNLGAYARPVSMEPAALERR
ncbi:MAG: sigma-E factor negative regulatory protein [Burkholderiales bacterium]